MLQKADSNGHQIPANECLPEHIAEATEYLLRSGIKQSTVEQVVNCKNTVPAIVYAKLLDRILAADAIAVLIDDTGEDVALDLAAVGNGGMAAVRLAWHIKHATFVAAKVSFKVSLDAPVQPVATVDTVTRPTTIVGAYDVTNALSPSTVLPTNVPAEDGTRSDILAPSAEQSADSASVGDQSLVLNLDELGDSKDDFVLDSGLQGALDRSQMSALQRDIHHFTQGKTLEGIDTDFNREIAAYEQMTSMPEFKGTGWFNGHKVLFTEFAEGAVSLQDVLRRGDQPFSALAVQHMLVVLARQLSRIHADRVMHRDLKPGNILLDEAGRLRIIDFGLAKNFGTDLDAHNRKYVVASITDATVRRNFEATMDHNGCKGTLAYMAPEQLGTVIPTEHMDAYHEVVRLRRDHRIDVFGFATTLYTLATGKNLLATIVELRKQAAKAEDNEAEVQLFSLLTNPATFCGKEFAAALAVVKDDQLRALLQQMLRFDPDERATLHNVAKQAFEATYYNKQYAGDFERFWEDEEVPTLPGYKPQDSVEQIAETVNLQVAAHRLRMQDHVVIGTAKAGRYIVQNRYLVAAVLAGSAVITGAGVYTVKSLNATAEARQTAEQAKAKFSGFIAFLNGTTMPTAEQCNTAVQGYNLAVTMVDSNEAEQVKQEVLGVIKQHPAFIVEFNGTHITELQPLAAVRKVALLAEFTKQIQALDGTATALDSVDLIKASALLGEFEATYFATDAATTVAELAGVLPTEYQLTYTDGLQVSHKQERADAEQLTAAFVNLNSVLQAEDGPQTANSQRALQLVNLLIANWKPTHRTSVLDTVEESGLNSLPSFIVYEYDEATADITLKNRYYELEDGSRVLETRFGSFNFSGKCLESITLGQSLKPIHTARFYMQGSKKLDSNISMTMYSKMEFSTFLKGLGTKINDVDEYSVLSFYFSGAETDKFNHNRNSGYIYIMGKNFQGVLRFDELNQCIDFLQTRDSLQEEDVVFMEHYASLDYTNYSCHEDNYVEFDKKLPNSIKTLLFYAGQFPVYSANSSEYEASELYPLHIRRADIDADK